MKCPHCNEEINIGRLIGKESGKNMTTEERKERAKKAAKARWKKFDKEKNNINK
jgi:hypothetical protein